MSNDPCVNTAEDVAKDAEAAFAQNDRWAMKFVFPLKTQMPSGEYEYMGLTKRELFAAMAMQALRTVNSHCSSQEIAQSAVTDADALLKELTK